MPTTQQRKTIMKNQPKTKSKNLVCPKAGTATSSPKINDVFGVR